ncbi:MAG TPA: UvrD-helicase domain-containing protein [Candidatus Deferrimicrobium sp.]|nr:UvrD-helicase domain-containing protein [Candidatus Deferrimicrobium sp.]
MYEYQENLQEEISYLAKTVDFIHSELDSEEEVLAEKKRELIALRRDMSENTVSFLNEPERRSEIYQYVTELNNKTVGYGNLRNHLAKYEKMLGSPYFARIDILEQGSFDQEKIYIGLANVMDRQTHEVYVYDWRSPISSLFYRYELGQGSYTAPVGSISCEIFRKRQFKILNSELKYFFDCSLAINDELLQEVLSHNSSPQMRNIVETIQREQDIIIRDVDNELLIVQGVAGSGKTSIALHRIAFLLYHGLGKNLTSTNFLIISPNDIFSQYISTVLPELGEENVAQTTFEEIALKHFSCKLQPEGRNAQLEGLLACQAGPEKDLQRQVLEFKGSSVFLQILDRFIRHYGRRMLPFQDVYFNGVVLATKQQLKNRFLKNEIDIPMNKQLKKIERMLLDKVHPLQKDRLARLEKIVQKSEGHELEIKSYSRLLAMKQAKIFLQRLQEFTTVDYVKMYETLFADRELFFRLSQGLELPENIEQIISSTREALNTENISYADCGPLLYLKLKLNGNEIFSEIKHVVIDEAQDYYPLHYAVFKLLFKDAKYTVLGDINQAIEKAAETSLYDEVISILAKDKAIKLFLTKSYRSSSEINEFTQKLLGLGQELTTVARHEARPAMIHRASQSDLDQAISQDIATYLDQGFESIAVICKTQQEAERLYQRLGKLSKVKLVSDKDTSIGKGVLIISAYLAKGLEFDVVLVYNASIQNYSDRYDRKLLYVACTRALHRLALYYTGEISPWLKFIEV